MRPALGQLCYGSGRRQFHFAGQRIDKEGLVCFVAFFWVGFGRFVDRVYFSLLSLGVTSGVNFR